MCGADLSDLDDEKIKKAKQDLLLKRYLTYQNPHTCICELLGVGSMMSSNDMVNLGKAIEEIGATESCITENVLKDVRKIVLEKGVDAAEIYAAQLTGTDQNTELSRVLKICRKHKLSPEAIAEVLAKLGKIESGKW